MPFKFDYMRLVISFVFCLPFALFSQLKKEYYDIEQTKLKSETDYNKGVPYGAHFEYYKSGKLSCIGHYYSGRLNYYLGKEDSVWTYFFEDGAVKAREYFSKGKKEGTNVYYFKSGKRSQITKFTNDLADSIWTSYFENGKVKSIEGFENGKKQGDWKYYHDNGQIESKGRFEKDKKEGEVNTYYRSGKPASVEHYCGGKPCGEWLDYYENGTKNLIKNTKTG